jgi:hypothetical protein
MRLCTCVVFRLAFLDDFVGVGAGHEGADTVGPRCLVSLFEELRVTGGCSHFYAMMMLLMLLSGSERWW